MRFQLQISDYNSTVIVMKSILATRVFLFKFFFLFFEIDSANRGDSLDRNINEENRSTKDFLILVSNVIKIQPVSFLPFRNLDYTNWHESLLF